MNKQKGLSLTGLLVWCVIIAVVALLGMKVAPAFIEYSTAMKDAKATINNVGAAATVPEVRNAFQRFADVDQLSIKAEDLEITKEGGKIVINLSYDKKIPLFANVNLLIEFRGSTAN